MLLAGIRKSYGSVQQKNLDRGPQVCEGTLVWKSLHRPLSLMAPQQTGQTDTDIRPRASTGSDENLNCSKEVGREVARKATHVSPNVPQGQPPTVERYPPDIRDRPAGEDDVPRLGPRIGGRPPSCQDRRLDTDERRVGLDCRRGPRNVGRKRVAGHIPEQAYLMFNN